MISFPVSLNRLENFGPYATCENFLSPAECRRLIGLMPDHKMVDAEVSESGGKNNVIRSTKVTALDLNDRNMWVFQKLQDAIVQLNAQFYGYDLVGFHEAIQLMSYKTGDHYDWHMDYGNQQFSQRKLSVSVQLTHPMDYEGGDLEFFRNGTAAKGQGTMILFPSFFYHKVHPIISGHRRALVTWIAGNPFK